MPFEVSFDQGKSSFLPIVLREEMRLYLLRYKPSRHDENLAHSESSRSFVRKRIIDKE